MFILTICLFLCCQQSLITKTIRLKCIPNNHYPSWKKFLALESLFNKYGIIFVDKAKKADAILCSKVTSDILSQQKKIIILDRHSAGINSETKKLLHHDNILAVFNNFILRPSALNNIPTQSGKYHFYLINQNIKRFSQKKKISDDIFNNKIYAIPWDYTLSPFSEKFNGLLKEEIDFDSPRPIDVSFVGEVIGKSPIAKANYFFGIHRNLAITTIKKIKGIRTFVSETPLLDFESYIDVMKQSKIVVSPWGFREWCFRDCEALLTGAILIKPDTSFVKTLPDLYQNNVTYVPCNSDFSDLERKIKIILKNYESYKKMRQRGRKLMLHTDKEILVKEFTKTIREILG